MLHNSNKNLKDRGIAPWYAKKWNIKVPDEPTKIGVPYVIDEVFSGREQTIRNAMDEIEANSCIR